MTFYELIKEDKPTLVDFFATWCGPCKMMSPILTDLKKRVGDKASIIKVDVDISPQVANTYRVQGVPTLILFRNGQPVWRKSGVIPANELEQAIRSNSK